MNVKRVDFESGWCDVEVGMSEHEIGLLIQNLCRLKKQETTHFHIVMDHDTDSMVADIEFHRKPQDSPDNMTIDGVPTKPSKE
jgi:hypothetical protein